MYLTWFNLNKSLFKNTPVLPFAIANFVIAKKFIRVNNCSIRFLLYAFMQRISKANSIPQLQLLRESSLFPSQPTYVYGLYCCSCFLVVSTTQVIWDHHFVHCRSFTSAVTKQTSPLLHEMFQDHFSVLLVV